MAWMRSGCASSMNARSRFAARRIVSGPNHCRMTVDFEPEEAEQGQPGQRVFPVVVSVAAVVGEAEAEFESLGEDEERGEFSQRENISTLQGCYKPCGHRV